MGLLHVLLVLGIAGFLVYLITLIPKPAVFNNLILGVAIIAAIIYVLNVFGVVTGLPRIR